MVRCGRSAGTSRYPASVALSEQTVGALVVLVGDLGHSDVTTLLMRAGLSRDDPGKENASRASRAAAALRGAHRRHDDAGLLECTKRVLNGGPGRDPGDERVAELVKSLRCDGWLAQHEVIPGVGARWSDRSAYRWTVEPLGTAELPLPSLMNSAKDELAAQGLDVAASHLGQAYRAFAAGDLEASNAQLQPAFESTL